MEKQFPTYKPEMPEPTYQPTNALASAISQESRIWNQVDKYVSGIAQNVTDQNAEEKGAEAGRSLSAQPGVELTRSDAIYNQSLKQAQKLTIQSTIRSNLNKMQQTYASPFTFSSQSLPEFTNAFSQFKTQLLTNTAPQQQAYARNMLDFYGSRLQNQLATKSYQLAKNKTQVDLRDYIEQTTQDMQKAALSGDSDAAAALGAQASQKLNTAFNTQMIPPDFYNVQSKALESAMAVGTYTRELNSHLGNPQQAHDLRQAFIDSDAMNDNPAQKTAMVLDSYGTQFQQAQYTKTNKQTIANDIPDAAAHMANGAAPVSYTGLESRVAQYTPAALPAYLKAKDQAVVVAATKRMIYGLPHEQIVSAVKSMLPDEPNFSQIQLYNKLQTLVSSDAQARKTDSLTYVMNSPAFQQYAETQGTYPGPLYGKEQPQQAAPTQIDDFVMGQFKNMELPQSQWRFLTVPQAKDLAQQFNSQNTAQNIQLLENLKAAHPSTMNYVVNNLKQAHANVEFDALNNLAENPALTNIYSAYASLTPKQVSAARSFNGGGDNTIADAVKMLNNNSQYQAYVNYINQNFPSHAASMLTQRTQQMAKFIQTMNGLAAQGDQDVKDRLNNLSPADAAVGIYLGQNIASTKVNGKTVLMPHSYQNIALPVDNVGSLLNAYFATHVSPDNLYAPPNTLPMYSIGKGFNKEQSYYDLIKHNFGARVNSTNNGLILTDTQGNPILNKNGKAFNVSFADLSNPSSPAMVKAHAYISKQQRTYSPLKAAAKNLNLLYPHLTSLLGTQGA